MSVSVTRRVYFAGELFSLKHLVGNAAFGAALSSESGGEFVAVLPQDLEQRETTPESIRNQDLKALLACDAALFNFDGDEIDSGTVLEYAFAKFCDIPSVVVRSDFRAQGDQIDEPWNLMLSFYPRTKVIVADAMAVYQKHLHTLVLPTMSLEERAQASVRAGLQAISELASQSVTALREVCLQPAQLPQEYESAIFEWARMCAGNSLRECVSDSELAEILQRRRALQAPSE